MVRKSVLYTLNKGSIPFLTTVVVSYRLLDKIVALVNAGSTPADHPMFGSSNGRITDLHSVDADSTSAPNTNCLLV